MVLYLRNFAKRCMCFVFNLDASASDYIQHKLGKNKTALVDIIQRLVSF